MSQAVAREAFDLASKVRDACRERLQGFLDNEASRITG
jgi:hypothetical protein